MRFCTARIDDLPWYKRLANKLRLHYATDFDVVYYRDPELKRVQFNFFLTVGYFRVIIPRTLMMHIAEIYAQRMQLLHDVKKDPQAKEQLK